MSTRGEQCSHAGSLDLLRDAYVEGASAPPELGHFAAIFRLRCSKRPRRVRPTDANPHFQRRAPTRSAANGVLATAEPCAAAGPALQHRRAHLLPADPAGSLERYRLSGTNGGWVLTPRRRLARLARKSAEPNPATEIVCPTEPLKKRWIPDPRRLPPVGKPCRALGRQRTRERAAPASDALSPVARNRFGLARPAPLPAATESGHTEPTPPTDFCNCQRAWAHRVNDCSSHRTRCFGAFCRPGNWLVRTSERHGSRS